MSDDILDLTALVPSKEAQERGIDVEIKFQGKPIGLVIRVAGPDSERQTSVEEEVYDRRDSKGLLLTPMRKDEIRDMTLRKLARATISWSPAKIKLGGEVYECSEDTAYALYSAWPAIRKQVQAKAFDEAPFITGSVTPSVEP